MDQTLAVKSNGNALAFAAVDPHQLAGRLKLMITNGKQLTDPECLALAEYALATDLNPLANECYYLPGVGPGPGIAGWRKKAEEQLEYEARRAAEPLARFWCENVDPEPGEVGSLSPGDIAVKSILHDTLTKNAWEKRTLSHYIELVKNGIKDNAWDIAKELAGPEPTWSAVGIVRANENFGGDKMNRYERACKRSDKAAIRKRFPRVNLPEPAGFDAADVIDATFTETPAPEQPKRTEAELLGDLGYGARSSGNGSSDSPSDKAWEEWDKLVKEADELKLTITVPPPGVTTPQLRAMYKELSDAVKAKKG